MNIMQSQLTHWMEETLVDENNTYHDEKLGQALEMDKQLGMLDCKLENFVDACNDLNTMEKNEEHAKRFKRLFDQAGPLMGEIETITTFCKSQLVMDDKFVQTHILVHRTMNVKGLGTEEVDFMGYCVTMSCCTCLLYCLKNVQADALSKLSWAVTHVKC